MQFWAVFKVKKYCEAIMSDLLFFFPNKKSYMAKLDLLKSLLKNGLKPSPMKCEHFRTELKYMENAIFFQTNRSLCEASGK